MSVSVLLVTPSKGFGELIRQTLEESGLYRVVIFTSGMEALDGALSGSFELSILDTDLVDIPILDLWRSLKELHPESRLIVIPPEDDLPLLQGLEQEADALLDKPFYLPSLLSTVAQVLARSSPEVAQEAGSQGPILQAGLLAAEEAPAPAGLPSKALFQDVSRVAQHLAQLSLESAAQAALITRQDQIWAYAGELPEPAAHELAGAVADYWAHDGESDLARFVRLEATGGEYMLYATALVDQLVLSLVFEASTPFSKIRSQAGNLARALASLPPDEQVPEQPPPEAENLPSTREDPDDIQLEVQPLLEDIPPPSPGDWLPETPEFRRPADLAEDSLANQLLGVFLESDREDLGLGVDDLRAHAASPERAQTAAAQPEADESPELEIDPVAWEPDYPAVPRTEKGRPEIQETVMGIAADPYTPVLQRINYTCLLIPRLPDHELTHDLADHLTRWMPQICLAYGWRLERLVIRPVYLLWVAEVPPEASPISLLDVIRQHTSQRIFDHFAWLKRENPSGDYWAPGYLLLSGSHPLSDQMIRDFIHRTRTWQGVRGRG